MWDSLCLVDELIWERERQSCSGDTNFADIFGVASIISIGFCLIFFFCPVLLIGLSRDLETFLGWKKDKKAAQCSGNDCSKF